LKKFWWLYALLVVVAAVAVVALVMKSNKAKQEKLASDAGGESTDGSGQPGSGVRAAQAGLDAFRSLYESGAFASKEKKLMEKIKADNPERYDRLMALKKTYPEKFKAELAKAAEYYGCI